MRDEWARPEFLEKAAEEVLKAEWAKEPERHTADLPLVTRLTLW
jgi:hypothetical protein